MIDYILESFLQTFDNIFQYNTKVSKKSKSFKKNILGTFLFKKGLSRFELPFLLI